MRGGQVGRACTVVRRLLIAQLVISLLALRSRFRWLNLWQCRPAILTIARGVRRQTVIVSLATAHALPRGTLPR